MTYFRQRISVADQTDKVFNNANEMLSFAKYHMAPTKIRIRNANQPAFIHSGLFIVYDITLVGAFKVMYFLVISVTKSRPITNKFA